MSIRSNPFCCRVIHLSCCAYGCRRLYHRPERGGGEITHWQSHNELRLRLTETGDQILSYRQQMD